MKALPEDVSELQRTIRYMLNQILQVAGPLDGETPQEIVASFVQKYQHEYRLNHPNLIHGC